MSPLRSTTRSGSDRRGPAGANVRPPYVLTAVALVASVGVSRVLPWARHEFGGNVPPLFAKLHPSIGPEVLVPVALAAAAWFAIPRLVRSPRWMFLAVVVLFGWAFALSLAAQSGGLGAISAPFRRSLDYWANVPLVQSLGPGQFASAYPHLIEAGRLSLHATTHPPGALLLLWALSRIGGGSVLFASTVVAGIGAMGALATYALARELYGEEPARVAAVLFACSPAFLLYSATSMDAVFMTVFALALAALVRAPRSGRWAVAAGLLTALALCFTFGALLLGPLAVGIGALAWNRIPRVALFRRAAFGVAALIAGAVLVRGVAGVDLVASFRAALHAHLGDVSHERSYLYWLVADAPAFLLAAGLAQSALFVAASRAAWRARRPGPETVLWGTLVLASVTGLFRGEVDHIWLFFVPLLTAIAASVVPSNTNDVRGPAVGGLSQAMIEEVLLYTFW